MSKDAWAEADDGAAAADEDEGDLGSAEGSVAVAWWESKGGEDFVERLRVDDVLVAPAFQDLHMVFCSGRGNVMDGDYKNLPVQCSRNWACPAVQVG